MRPLREQLFRIEEVQRFQYSRFFNPDSSAHEQQDALYFQRMEDNSYRIKAPFIAIYFDEKINRVFIEKPKQIKRREVYPM